MEFGPFEREFAITIVYELLQSPGIILQVVTFFFSSMLQKLQVITKDFFSSICKIYEYDIIEDPKGGGEKTTQDHFPGVPSFFHIFLL